LTTRCIWLGGTAELLRKREQRGFQSLPAIEKSDGKHMLDEPRVVESPAAFRVRMPGHTTQVRRSKAEAGG